MKRTQWLVVAILSLMTAPVLAMSGNINGFIGQKSLENDWKPVEDQMEVGVVADFRDPAWPISIATDLFYSWDDSGSGTGSIDGMTVELDVGVRKLFGMSGYGYPMHPYVGGGLALVMADVDAPGGSDDDTGAGYWVGGGILWTMANRMNLGLDVRYSDAEVTLHNVDVNAGGTHYGILIGYQW